LWLGASSVEAQKPRVVVMDFTGSNGAKARAQVIRALRDEAQLEPRSEAKEVLRARSAKVSSVSGRAAIAEELGLNYVIWGRVRGRGSAARAEIRIAGPKGKQITERKAGPPGQSKGNEKIRRAARAALAKAMEVAPAKRRARNPEPIEVDEVEIAVGEITIDDEKKTADRAETRKAAKPAAAAAAPNTKTKREDPEKPKREKSAKRNEQKARSGLQTPIFNILGGAGGRVRKVEIDVDDGSGGTATRSYESGVYLDIVFRLELRPLARNRKPGLRGIALEADGDFGVGLDTKTPGSGATLDTKAWRVLGQLGYFHALKKSEIGGLIGIGFDALDLEDNGSMPSIRYLFLRVGPAYRHFFIERLLYLRVDAGFRFPFSYGDLEKRFGEAKGFGFDAGLTLGGELDVGFSYLLRISSDYFKPQFSAFPGGVVPGLPGAAQGKDGRDLAINFHVMVGWSF
jgi:hypothetical protein